MTACLCGLALSLLSAASADLETTRQFTERDIREANPIARPFVEGRGSRGELTLGVVTATAYLALAGQPGAWQTAVQGLALAAHSILAVRNVRLGSAHEVPTIVWPVLVISW